MGGEGKIWSAERVDVIKLYYMHVRNSQNIKLAEKIFSQQRRNAYFCAKILSQIVYCILTSGMALSSQ